MSRIQNSDTVAVAIARMADNSGIARLALFGLHTLGSRIDPDAGEIAGFRAMQTLDELGLYGRDIEQLMQDACRTNPTHMAAFCRAVQLGLIPRDQAVAIARGQAPANMNDILARVQAELPNFGRCESCGSPPGECGEHDGVF